MNTNSEIFKILKQPKVQLNGKYYKTDSFDLVEEEIGVRIKTLAQNWRDVYQIDSIPKR